MEITYSKNKTQQDTFLQLLQNLEIEKALEKYTNNEVKVIYNNKPRLINKQSWIRYIKKNILNKFTNIVQFNIKNIETEQEELMFKIFMICKRTNGQLDFTEVQINNIWKNNHINTLKYNLISH